MSTKFFSLSRPFLHAAARLLPGGCSLEEPAARSAATPAPGLPAACALRVGRLRDDTVRASRPAIRRPAYSAIKTLCPFLAFAGTALATTPTEVPDFRRWASRPPMGWNSWDNFGTTIAEAQARAQAKFMSERLRPFGWEYLVVDIQWYEPGAKGHDYRKDAELTMDGFGRLQPAPNRFPSAADGAGFKALADYVHGLGLKFGIHLMRGIPRQAVEKNLPIRGTGCHAADIADKNSTCPWNPDMFGIDMTKPGAQEYYNSVFELIASWGVDYVKVDDIARPYRQSEIEAIRRAIDHAGRPIVLSLSPGDTPLSAAEHVKNHANLWRISDDFWDRWLALRGQFGRLEKWNSHRVPGAWPDADMLPLGVLDLGRRTTRFTPDEQRTLMTLWSIARSPLMHGGDLTQTDDFTRSLLTNAEVLAVDQDSVNNRPLFNKDDLIAWTADVPGTRDKYLAVFNARDRVRLEAANARYASPAVTRDLRTSVAIDVDVQSASRLFLVARANEDGSGAQALWQAPRLVFADGNVRPLTEFTWTHADARWDSTRVKKDAAGAAVGVTALAPAVVEYALPPGVVRFQANAGIDPDARSQGPEGSLRFLVVLATPENEDPRAGVPVPVDLAGLGLASPVRIRDLWTHRDLGEFQADFAPEIPWHGAGLFRLSPR